MSALFYSVRNYFAGKRVTLRILANTLGHQLMLFIGCIQFATKGFVFGGGAGGLIGRPIEFLFQSYTLPQFNMNAQAIQIYRNVALTPWAIKSLIGMLTDTIHIGGYNKVPYIFTVNLAASLACLCLAMAWPLSPVLTTVLLFVMFLYASVADLLTEAMYSKKIRQNPTQGVDIISFVLTGIFIGQILSTILVGFLIDSLAPHWIYLLPVPLFVATLYPIYQNWMGDRMHVNHGERAAGVEASNDDDDDDDVFLVNEEEAEAENTQYITNLFGSYGLFLYHHDHAEQSDAEPQAERTLISGADGTLTAKEESTSSSLTDSDEESATPLVGINLDKIRLEKNAFIMAGLIGAISLSTSLMAISGVSVEYLFAFSLLAAVAMIAGFLCLIGGVTARIQIYVILQNMFSISISGAEFFFFTDTAEQYPEGPHFGKKFYVIVVGLVASVCLVVGTLTYSALMKHWKYRQVFLFTTLFSVCLGLANIVMYKRWNLLLGIPDWAFVLGAEAVQIIVAAWNNIPATTMLSKLCPPGMEATMFALLAGSSNLGGSLAVYQGTFVMKLLGVNPSGARHESAQFENLWLASLISTLLSLVTVAFVVCFIPDRYQTESLLGPGDEEVEEALRVSVLQTKCSDAFITEVVYDTTAGEGEYEEDIFISSDSYTKTSSDEDIFITSV